MMLYVVDHGIVRFMDTMIARELSGPPDLEVVCPDCLAEKLALTPTHPGVRARMSGRGGCSRCGKQSAPPVTKTERRRLFKFLW